MTKIMKVLFCPINYVGPVNAAIGMAEVLRDSGHKVVFAVKSVWSGKLKIHGFEEEIIGNKEVSDDCEGGSAKENAESVAYLLGPNTRIEKVKYFYENFLDDEIKSIEDDNPLLEDIVKRVKPDVLVMDQLFWIPALMGSGIPWVWTMSCNPLTFLYGITDDLLPPMWLGLPTNGDKNEWKRMREEGNEALHQKWQVYNNWIVSKGYPSLPKDKMITASPYLNVYLFPKELDYTDIRPNPPNFFGFDCMKRTGSEEVFELPEKLRNRSGKLIYLSMGSMGGGNVELMKRLVAYLSKSKHRFIISKGPFGDEYELADNMWGHNYLPQIKILPIIDLIISHGGNNTLTETLYYGKLILVMPLFTDQFDNAQRLVEKGLSIELNPFECSEQQLNESIDKLLSDKTLEQKMIAISKRIQSEQNILKLPKLLENLIK